MLARLQALSFCLYLGLAIGEIFFYTATALKDPGYIQQDELVPIKRCGQCRLQVGRGSVHCPVCARCVKGYDHHCPWVGKCIGQNNLLLFKFFLCTMSSAFIVGIVVVIIP
jgi:hypothetical protein